MGRNHVNAAALVLGCLLARSSAEPFNEVHSIAKPHGHTSQVSPHRGAHDREWYVEARWKTGPYPVQDGVITEKPQHVPAPVKQPEERTTRQAGRMLRNKGHQPAAEGRATAEEGRATAASHGTIRPAGRGAATTGGEAVGAEAASHHEAGRGDKPVAESAALNGDAEATKAKKQHKLKGRRTQTREDTKLSLGKPHGHTSQVSPHKGASDVEWHVEARWKSGPYPVQDGVITDKPQLVPSPTTREEAGAQAGWALRSP